ncbi:MAG: fibro-slime domain-containing protein [Planctomycetota bacterium]|nr:fibro-slime domain-containing protein [Planctomycetota bacterium]
MSQGYTNVGTGRNKASQGRAAVSAVAILALAGTFLAVRPESTVANRATDQFAHLPSSLQLNATIRDFKGRNVSGGHPDFEAFSGTTTVGLVAAQLDANRMPVPISLRGQTINTEFRDRLGRNINPAMFNATLGDVAGRLTAGGTGNGLTSFDSFRQWYRDVPGVNLSKNISLTLNRVPNTNRYVFDSANDEPYRSLGGFFPINGEMYGNSGTNSAGKVSNFHFTTEVRTEFVYNRGTGQTFMFSGDDDVWVFIDGRMVIDLGGLHSRKEQWLDLDRLSWLQDGLVYRLEIFHAERRTNQSNFRMETTLQLRTVTPPAVGQIFD